MLACNWIDFHEETKKIEQLGDKAEKETRTRLLDAIIDKINDYNCHLIEYEYGQKRAEVLRRGVVFSPLPHATGVKAMWSRLFASQVDAREKRRIGYDQYKWHIFSFECVEALAREQAREAFDRCKKARVYVFYQHDGRAFLIENADLLRSGDFDLDYDVYVFDAQEKWTYVHTHETEQCGPYFYRV